MMINKFIGDYDFLSNFYECKIKFGKWTYNNCESAFQAQKTLNEDEKKNFISIDPYVAKKIGRKIKLRPDWEKVKTQIMYEICKAKFTQHPQLRKKILSTCHHELIESNTTFTDKFWGKCDGIGENYLGRILMRIRNELRGFDVAKITDKMIQWIIEYFEKSASPETKSVIGISGGKDSSVAAALCAKALGTNRVFGVLMPCGTQVDINFSRQLVNILGIKNIELNILDAFNIIMTELNNTMLNVTEKAQINTPARLRMTILYMISACVEGRVVNTCNLSENWMGYTTKFGDGAGDFSLLSDLTVTEVVAIGDYLGLPYDLVHKTPIDGLCGKTDEENFGFTYAELDDYIRGFDDLSGKPKLKAKINRIFSSSRHKFNSMPKFTL